MCACPETSGVTPMTPAPSKNSTAPGALEGSRLRVKVIACPKTDGLDED